MQVVPAGPGSVLVSIEYPADGLAWARLYDNQLIGWCVDETGAAESLPSIVGQLPTAPPDTGAILSPQWVQFTDPTIFVPDLWRGSLHDFFTWLATNNGATRPLAARFGISSNLVNGFDAWAKTYPALVYVEPPPEEGGMSLTTFAVAARRGHAATRPAARGRD